MTGERLILSGDIGGTKTYLALFSLRDGALDAVREGAYQNDRYSGPEEVLRDFLRVGEARAIEAASFGIACPVVGNRCVLTNLNWTVDGAAMRATFGLKKLTLINDLESIGWGVELLSAHDFFVLQHGVSRQGNAALIAAGTGLGEAILFWNGSHHVPSASEGGHTDFGPKDHQEAELLEFLMKKYGHVSYERIVSGMGIENIYEFMKAKHDGGEPEWLKERFAAEGIAPVVSEEGMKGSDKDCRDALKMFVSVYGAEAGNLALKSLAVHGVYIGGGIAPKIIDALSDGTFLSAFEDKGRFRDFMKTIPVRIILNDRTGLIGAANHAASSLGESVRKATLPGGR